MKALKFSEDCDIIKERVKYNKYSLLRKREILRNKERAYLYQRYVSGIATNLGHQYPQSNERTCAADLAQPNNIRSIQQKYSEQIQI